VKEEIMVSLDDLLQKGRGRLQVFKNYHLTANRDLTEKITICIPDTHLLEKRQTDDFFDGHPEYEERFLSLLDFLVGLRTEEGDGLEIIQIGDYFDLWQAKGNTNLILAAYPSIVGLLEKVKPIYLVGNHDIDLVRWYKDQGETFGRRWRYYTTVSGKLRVIYEHGFQADFFNNQESWSGIIGREVTKIVGMMEYINPNIDEVLGSAWDSVTRVFDKYNVFTPVNDPQGFNAHEYLRYYVNLLARYNRGETFDHYGPENMDLGLVVIGHTHNARLVQMPQAGRIYYLLDCGAWVNGRHEVGVVSGKDKALCQWR
jgi:UDP-2,3-diacylglucosamine pyrophosphatase LpxH